jgi:hypothetical protein
MLAQNFKTATDLGITDAQRSALQKTLVLMETGKMQHVPAGSDLKPLMDPGEYAGLFTMHLTYADADCGTAGCIRGTAQMISGVYFDVCDLTTGLNDLFYEWAPCKNWDPSVEQAAIALRNYLTFGEPRWADAAQR